MQLLFSFVRLKDDFLCMDCITESLERMLKYAADWWGDGLLKEQQRIKICVF